MDLRCITDDGLFELLDIPMIFADDKIEAPFYTRMLNQLNPENPNLKDIFNTQHIGFMFNLSRDFIYHVFMNRFHHDGLSKENKRILTSGIIAHNFTLWDYSETDPNVAIDSGLARFREFYDADFYVRNPQYKNYAYVPDWLNNKVNREMIETMIRLQRIPYEQIPDSLSEGEKFIISILRDSKNYTMMYMLSLVIDNMKDRNAAQRLIGQLIAWNTVNNNCTTAEALAERIYNFYFENPNLPPVMSDSGINERIMDLGMITHSDSSTGTSIIFNKESFIKKMKKLIENIDDETNGQFRITLGTVYPVVRAGEIVTPPPTEEAVETNRIF